MLKTLLVFFIMVLFLESGFGQTEEIKDREIKPESKKESVIDNRKPAPVKNEIKEGKEDIKKETPTVKKTITTKEKRNVDVKKSIDKKKGKKEIIEDEKIDEDSGSVDNGLMEIVEGDFKYKRIPEIEIPERALIDEESIETEKANEEGIEKSQDKSEKKGLLGLSRKTTDILAKVILILIIIAIFILYRSRSKDKRSNVLRRFPKV